MKTYINKLYIIIFFSLIWCILNEQFNLLTFFIGIIVSIITFFILSFIQPNKNIDYSYHISIFQVIIFFIILIKDIYISALLTIKHILKNEINPQFIHTYTKINNPWLQALIGNAITLTPGTVTIHMSDGSYTILWLYPTTANPKIIKKDLIDNFENIFKSRSKK